MLLAIRRASSSVRLMLCYSSGVGEPPRKNACISSNVTFPSLLASIERAPHAPVLVVRDIGRGTMSGREVLLEIALIPVALAFGATLIGLAWVIFG